MSEVEIGSWYLLRVHHPRVAGWGMTYYKPYGSLGFPGWTVLVRVRVIEKVGRGRFVVEERRHKAVRRLKKTMVVRWKVVTVKYEVTAARLERKAG